MWFRLSLLPENYLQYFYFRERWEREGWHEEKQQQKLKCSCVRIDHLKMNNMLLQSIHKGKTEVTQLASEFSN